jgi:hypothetical protein
VLSSRGIVLPDQTFFSQNYSKKDFKSGGSLDEMSISGGTIKAAFHGNYYYYQFDSQGISKNAGASFVLGAGVRPLNANASVKPKTIASAKLDFGGFVIWGNGRTSMFRSPEQIGVSVSNNPNDFKPTEF